MKGLIYFLVPTLILLCGLKLISLSTIPNSCGLNSGSSHDATCDTHSVAKWEPFVKSLFPSVNNQLQHEISVKDWQEIQTSILRYQYKLHPNTDGGFLARNASNHFTVEFNPNGRTSITGIQENAHSLAFHLRAIGADQMTDLFHPESILESASEHTPGSKVTYTWNENLTEWWHNSPEGLEQWFLLKEAPEGKTENEPLRLDVGVTTDLQMHVTRQAVTFSKGQEHFNYTKFKAWDANGKDLAVRFEAAKDQQGILLVVDDAQAQYPITIDPLLVSGDYIKASNTNTNDYFGFSVAVDGNVLLVGAPLEDSFSVGVNGSQTDNSMNGAGAAYVFRHNGTTWVQEAYLKASAPGVSDNFGWSVDVSGNTIVVGAPMEQSNATGINGNATDNSAAQAGAAYIYRYNGSSWVYEAYLKASNNQSGDRFGTAVAISGNKIVVGSPFEDSNATGINGNGANNTLSASGAVYVFAYNGSSWSQEAYMKASNTGGGDYFGEFADIDANTIVVGARFEQSNATGVNGNQSDNSASQSGAAYVFTFNGSNWVQQAYLKASNTGVQDYFGISVNVSGNKIVIGASGEDSNATGVNGNQSDNSILNPGAAYVFAYDGSNWGQQAYLKAPNPSAGQNFGSAVAILGSSILVGGYGENGSSTGVNGNYNIQGLNSSGAAYLYTFDGTNWIYDAYLKASNTGTPDHFGHAVALSASHVVVGARQESSNATGINGDQLDNSMSSAGAVYTFVVPNPLSLEVSDIEVSCVDGSNSISWNTSSELNTQSFILEGSEDGVTFDVLQTVPALGTSQSFHQYVSKAFPTSGYNYFRLSSLSTDGSIMELEVLTTIDCTVSEELSVYPNPCNDRFTVVITANDKTDRIGLYSASGQLLKSVEIGNQMKQVEIDLSGFETGVYYLKSSDKIIRLVKQE